MAAPVRRFEANDAALSAHGQVRGLRDRFAVRQACARAPGMAQAPDKLQLEAAAEHRTRRMAKMHFAAGS